MSALQARVKSLEQGLSKTGSSAQFQYVSVRFPATARADVLIKHNFRGDFERIRYLIVGMDLATIPAETPYIYRDASVLKKPWTRDTIYLRSNLANLTVRLLLFLEA
jgi:hypothetical protein